MDIQKYIESGILELYCLGLLHEEDQAYLIQMTMLYPEIKDELTAVEVTLEQFAGSLAVEPPTGAKQRLFDTLDLNRTEQPVSLDKLPPIGPNADLDSWLKVLGHMIPENPTENFMADVIRKDDCFQQMLVTSDTNVPEEEHGDLIESFFILKGRCECTIGNKLYQLSAGDFIEIPLNTPHDIRLLTPYVTAILQYEFV